MIIGEKDAGGDGARRAQMRTALGDALGIGVDEGAKRQHAKTFVDGAVRGLLESEIEVDVRDAEGIGTQGDDGGSFGHLVATPAAKAIAGLYGSGLGLSFAPLEEQHCWPAQHEVIDRR